jgi:hypothetical protein
MSWLWQLIGTIFNLTLALHALVSSYPEHISGHDYLSLVWRDGARMPVGADVGSRGFEEMLLAPTVLDQFAIPYHVGRLERVPSINEDPGRIRNQEFFVKMYGDCRADQVAPRLVRVPWAASRGGGEVLATTVNGVAERLTAVSAELEKLPPRFTKFVVPTTGAYNCRDIAGTGRLSMHSYGAAIDVNIVYGDYWRWRKGPVIWTNRIPYEIVQIFESHGFIWGGKWHHYDTLHFEYRPELILLSKLSAFAGGHYGQSSVRSLR